MSKKKVIILVAVVAFLALTAISTFAVVARNAHASNAKTTTIHLAFTGLVTKGEAKGNPIIGGLTEVVQSTGYFNGNLHQSDGTQISTSGKLDDGNITISFYNVIGAPVIKGVGHFTKAGDFVGTFQVFYGDKKIDTGIWSALPVNEPEDVTAFSFVGVDIGGHNAGVAYTGALVLNKKTLAGTFNLPDGTIVPVTAILNKNHVLKVRFHLSEDVEIIGIGTPSHEGNLKGFAGTFTGPVHGDTGKWVAYGFSF